jgi:hypothetical protein
MEIQQETLTWKFFIGSIVFDLRGFCMSRRESDAMPGREMKLRTEFAEFDFDLI